jgi:hypothetical protein
MELVARGVDEGRWDDLVELFGPSGGTRGCWCMARRLPAAEVAANGGTENRAALEGFVRAGTPVGLIGYVDERPVAWCAVAPRTEYYAIVHSRTLPIDELPRRRLHDVRRRTHERQTQRRRPPEPLSGVA